MKIKRYTAPSMRAALALVRAEQGPDAVILSSRRGEDGIEVIAAVDYDEALFADAARQRAASIPEPEPAKEIVALAQASREPQISPAMREAAAAAALLRAPLAPAAAAAAAPAAKPVAPRASAPNAQAPANGAAMQREIQDLRRLLETGLAGMTWSDKRLREPLQARVLEELSAMDIAPDVAMALAALTPRSTALENPSHIPMALLCRHLPMINDTTSVTGGITAIVGPTGAGKTTTIAKLAARWCMLHGSQDLALVSTDGYRIGAREQLNTYARILGVPMHAANTGKELARVSRAPQVQETDSDRHGGNGTARCTPDGAAGGLEARRGARQGAAGACPLKARAMRWMKSCALLRASIRSAASSPKSTRPQAWVP